MRDIYYELLNQTGGGSIDLSRGFSGLGNLPPIDWMPNPAAGNGVDVQFPWNAADPYTYFRWYESVQFERAREEDRRLLLGDAAKTSRMLLAGKFSEIPLDTGPQTKIVNGVEYEFVDIAGYKFWREVNPLAPRSQGGQPTASPKPTQSPPDWLEEFAAPYPLGPTALSIPTPTSPTPTPTLPAPPPASNLTDAFFGVRLPTSDEDYSRSGGYSIPSPPPSSLPRPQPSIASLTEEFLYRDLKESGYSAAALNRLNKYYSEERFPLSGGNLRELLLKRSAAFATAFGGQWRQGDYLYAIHNAEAGLLDLAGATIAGETWEQTTWNLVTNILFAGVVGAGFRALGGLGAGAAEAAGDTGGTLAPELESALPPASSSTESFETSLPASTSASLPPNPASAGLPRMSDRAIAQQHLFNVNAANVLKEVPFLRAWWRRILGVLNQRGLVSSLGNNPATRDLYLGFDQPPGVSVPDLLHTGSGTGKPFLEVTSLNPETVAAHRRRWYWEYSDPLLYPNAPSGWNIWQAPGGKRLRIWQE